MLPTAGLYLPQSLHHTDTPVLQHYTDEPELYSAENKVASLKSFQRWPRQGKNGKTEVASPDRTLLVNTVSQESDDCPLTQIVFTFADFVSVLGKASPATQAFANLIHNVRKDDAEASRLYSSPAILEFMDIYPDQRAEIDLARAEVSRTLNNIGAYVESIDVGSDGGNPAGMQRKFKWISNHEKKLVTRKLSLTVCHQRLVTAIRVMEAVERCRGIGQETIYEAPTRPWNMNELQNRSRSSYSRMPGQRNMSVSSIALFETDEENMDSDSVVSAPAELPDRISVNLSYSEPRASTTTTDSDAARRYLLASNPSINELESRVTDLNIQSDTSALKQTSSPIPNHSLPQLPIDHQHARVFHHNARLGVSQAHEQLVLPSATRQSSYPDMQISPQSSPTHQPSIDTTYYRSTVSEKTIQRNNSTISTRTRMRPRRYRPPSFDSRKAYTNRQSICPELPYLASQSSLVEDLADWMSPDGGNAESDHTEEVYSPTSSTFALSSRVVGSSNHFSSSTSNSSSELAISMSKMSLHDPERRTSLQATSSRVTRKPVPSSETGLGSSVLGPVAASKTTRPGSSNVGLGIEAYTDVSLANPIMPGTVPGDDDISPLQQRLLQQDYVEQVSDLTTQPNHQDSSPPQPRTDTGFSIHEGYPVTLYSVVETPASSPPPITIISSSSTTPSSSASMNTVSSSTQSTLMTAQAKRRVALTRRMQRDFGGG